MYLHEQHDWTRFAWDDGIVLPRLEHVRFAQGKLHGMAAGIGFELKADAEVVALSDGVVASSEIEGVKLDPSKVRSSVSRQLGLEAPKGAPDTHAVDGAVSVLLDATQNYGEPITEQRLLGWHNALFPTGYSGLRKINVARYRTEAMQVVSGPIGHERVHFEAVGPERVGAAMEELLGWLNEPGAPDSPLRAGIAHLWFLTIHPFDDGNGRIARALTDLLLARSDGNPQRLYSMATFILAHREDYYRQLESAQHGTTDITGWLRWFLDALASTLDQSMVAIGAALARQAFWQGAEGLALNERQRKMLYRLQGGFEGKLTASKWAKICKVSPDTALRDINDLVGKGLLARSPEGGRSTSYRLAGSSKGD